MDVTKAAGRVVAMADWYKHRDAWRAHYRDRSGRLWFVRAECVERQVWEIWKFDSSLNLDNIATISVEQCGRKALPKELKTWVRRRAAHN
jgi:hypothetical protein